MTTTLERVRAAYEQHRQGESNPLRRAIAAGDEKPAPPWEKLSLAVREAIMAVYLAGRKDERGKS
jgi:hypothetical protein